MKWKWEAITKIALALIRNGNPYGAVLLMITALVPLTLLFTIIYTLVR